MVVAVVVVAREGPDMIVVAFLRRRQGPRRASAQLGSPRFLRPGSRMLLYLLPITLGGCRSMMHQADSPPAQSSANGAVMPGQSQDSSVAVAARGQKPAAGTAGGTRDKNGFSDKLTPEQQYNAHIELGRFQESQENFDLALGEYLKALEASESRSTLLGGAKNTAKQALAHRRMGSALDRLGRFEQAENEYSTALKLSPNDPKIWNDAGYSYYLQSRWTDSERALKTAAKLDPNNTKIMTNLGLNLAASGKTDEALAEFTKAGGRAAGHTNLGYILAAMGKTAEAEKHYKLALEYQPQMEPARAALSALSARSAYEVQIAAASGPPAGSAPLLIGQPGVLPVAALRQPPPSGTEIAAASAPPAGSAPLLIGQPGVLPVAALRQPPPSDTQFAVASALPAAAAPLLIGQPGVLPVAALRQYPPSNTQIAVASAPPAAAAPVLIGQPGVLPAAALRQPPPSGTQTAAASKPPVATGRPPVRQPGVLPTAALRQPPPSGTQTAAASKLPVATARPPVRQPGVLPAAALRQPPSSATTKVAQAPRIAAPSLAGQPNPSTPLKPARTLFQGTSAARVVTPVPGDPAVKRTAAPTPTTTTTVPAARWIPGATSPLPVPAPMPKPAPVPPFVPRLRPTESADPVRRSSSRRSFGKTPRGTHRGPPGRFRFIFAGRARRCQLPGDRPGAPSSPLEHDAPLGYDIRFSRIAANGFFPRMSR